MNELDQMVIKCHTLFMKYGIKSVSMDDIARELGISKKTIYQYVSDKNELVSKAFDFDQMCMQDKLDVLNFYHLNAIDQIFEAEKMILSLLREHNPAVIYDLKKYYPSIYTKMVATRREKVSEFIIDNIEKGKRELFFREEIDAEIMAKFYLLRIEGIVDGDILTLEEYTSIKWVKELLNYHLRGITTPIGLEYFEKKFVEFNLEF